MLRTGTVKRKIEIGDTVYKEADVMGEGRVDALSFIAFDDEEDCNNYYGHFKNLETNETVKLSFEKIYFTEEEASTRLADSISRRKETLGR